LIPEVAQSLPDRSPDGRTYTFKIRPGFRFSPPSNEPVTAQTFKDTIERTLNPRTQSSYAQDQDLSDIVGAGAYMSGKASHVAGVIANGDTLTIRLLAPAPDFRLSSPFGGDSSVRKRDLDAGGAEIDHRDQGVRGVESVGAV
jgi:ABC-type oligopeptide transport system substrate-binding subunit